MDKSDRSNSSHVFLQVLWNPLRTTFVDLGMSPLCESYVSRDQLNQMEPFYPLHVYVCGECFLVQLETYVERRAHFQRIRLLFLVLR